MAKSENNSKKLSSARVLDFVKVFITVPKIESCKLFQLQHFDLSCTRCEGQLNKFLQNEITLSSRRRYERLGQDTNSLLDPTVYSTNSFTKHKFSHWVRTSTAVLQPVEILQGLGLGH